MKYRYINYFLSTFEFFQNQSIISGKELINQTEFEFEFRNDIFVWM